MTVATGQTKAKDDKYKPGPAKLLFGHIFGSHDVWLIEGVAYIVNKKGYNRPGFASGLVTKPGEAIPVRSDAAKRGIRAVARLRPEIAISDRIVNEVVEQLDVWAHDTSSRVSSPSEDLLMTLYNDVRREYIDPRDGLLAQQLRRDVEKAAPFAVDGSGRLYAYGDGVWRPGGATAIRRRVSALLGDKYRKAHAATVVELFSDQEPLFTDATYDTKYLNVPNGLLDWRTGALQPHDPAVPSTIRLPVEWDPSATCPRIDAWLSEVLDEDCQEFIREVIGYAMFNGNPLHQAIMLYASGRNGKGSFLRLLTALVGAENVSAESPQALDSNRFRAAELYGKLANLAGDVDPKIFKETENFKKITGGDLVSTERKNGHPFTFVARALMICSFNKMPRTADSTEGFFSRWTVVPFTGYFPAGKANPGIETQMHTTAELQGLLVAGVAGLQRVMARGRFDIPESVRAATAEFRVAADPIRAFLVDQCTAGPEAFTPRRDIYGRYKMWCGENGHTPQAATGFYGDVVTAAPDSLGVGVRETAVRGVRGIRGVALRPVTHVGLLPTYPLAG